MLSITRSHEIRDYMWDRRDRQLRHDFSSTGTLAGSSCESMVTVLCLSTGICKSAS